jgi:hypothetical protein
MPEALAFIAEGHPSALKVYPRRRDRFSGHDGGIGVEPDGIDGFPGGIPASLGRAYARSGGMGGHPLVGLASESKPVT